MRLPDSFSSSAPSPRSSTFLRSILFALASLLAGATAGLVAIIGTVANRIINMLVAANNAFSNLGIALARELGQAYSNQLEDEFIRVLVEGDLLSPDEAHPTKCERDVDPEN